MQLRSLLVIGLLGAVAASFASFEMMLLATNDGVYRYDPQNNVMLGRFGDFGVGHYDVAVDPTRPGEALTLGWDGVVTRYNYSTGEIRGGFYIGQIYLDDYSNLSVSAAGNIIYTGPFGESGYRVSRVYNSEGALIRVLESGENDLPALDGFQMPNGSYHTIVRRRNGTSFSNFTYDFFLNSYESNGSFIGSATIRMGSTSLNAASHLGLLNGKLFASSRDFSNGVGGGYFFNENFLGSAIAINTSGVTSTYGATNFVSAHFGYGYMVHGGDNNRLVQYNPYTGRASSTNRLLPLPIGINGSAIVLAPEPGTMIALGLGLAAVVRRRRSRA